MSAFNIISTETAHAAVGSPQRRRSGFTLVEILLVVIILGVLAAIVIPQFTNASSDAKRNSLSSSLHALRSQLELYMLQHGDATAGRAHFFGR